MSSVGGLNMPELAITQERKYSPCAIPNQMSFNGYIDLELSLPDLFTVAFFGIGERMIIACSNI